MNIPKLSDAILLGIGAVREARMQFLLQPAGMHPCGCAIGTALYAMGAKKPCYTAEEAKELLTATWPWVTRDLANRISLYHCAGWSREAIAAWIATIEEQEEPQPAPMVPAREDVEVACPAQ